MQVRAHATQNSAVLRRCTRGSGADTGGRRWGRHPHCRHVAARVCSHHHPGCVVVRVARCVAQLSRSSPEIDRHEHRPATLPSWGYARVSYWRRISEHFYGWSPRADADLVGEITGYVSSEI
jgi:hypothetical protein